DAEALAGAVSALGGVSEVSNLLVPTHAGEPPGWRGLLSFAARALGNIEEGRIRVEAADVRITALVDSEARARALSRDWNAAIPDGVTLTLDLTAPLPVISPFLLDFRLSGAAAKMPVCSAGTKKGRDRILSAARRAGADAHTGCRIGLGSPSPQWPRAADLAIAAIERMGGGTLEMRDETLRLTGPSGIDRGEFDGLMRDLRSTLPKMFTLEASLPDADRKEETADAQSQPRFVARLSRDGTVGLAGPVRDGMTEQAVRTYAESLFGYGRVRSEIQRTDGLPEGWSGRVLAGLETLSLLRSGSVEVTPRDLLVAGRSDSETIGEEVRDVLRYRLGAGAAFRTDVSFDPALIPPEKPVIDPRACEARIERLLKGSQIVFEPNSVDLEADSIPVIDAIADILRKCPDARFEIGGHTDSQGREVLNAGLSQSRADAVLDALLAREVLVSELVARGYGETRPIADNNTDEGRQANRRIEFRLLGGTDEQE
ncbi:MAG: OmpA family protein, partial [Paracoccaceae bacterium]